MTETSQSIKVILNFIEQRKKRETLDLTDSSTDTMNVSDPDASVGALIVQMSSPIELKCMWVKLNMYMFKRLILTLTISFSSLPQKKNPKNETPKT